MKTRVPSTTGPSMVSIDVTYNCTMRCLHCFNISGEHTIAKDEMSDRELLNVSEQVGEMRPTVVCFCGGEPLMRFDIISDCCEVIRNISKQQTQVNMVSNAELLTEEKVAMIKELRFSSVQISLDGASAQTHEWLRNKPGVFDKAVNALLLLKKYGVNSSVSCSPTKMNLHEVDKIITLCEELGVSSFRMQPLMPLGRANQSIGEYIPAYEEYRELSRLLLKLQCENIATGKMSIEWGDPIDHLIRFRSILKDNNLSIGINAYGEITVSPYIPVIVGNLRKHTIKDYWSAGLYRAWQIPIVQWFSEQILSCDHLDLSNINGNAIPQNYYDNNIEMDLIDDEGIFEISAKTYYS